MNALVNLDGLMAAAIAGLVALAVLIILIVLLIRQNRILRRYRHLLNGNSEQDLESLLLQQAQTIGRLEAHVQELSRELQRYSVESHRHLQKVGVVRFNAFPDTGSDLSFAIALLDGENNGVVLSSLYGRAESRTYAKPVKAGESTYLLSDEEQEALAKAISADQPSTVSHADR